MSMKKQLIVYVSDHDYSPDDVVAVRYKEGGERTTTWFRRASCNSLGLVKGKTYRITVEQLPDEYI